VIGVVIVSFNTVALLRDCLASLHVCTLPLRVIVVDNASADASATMVRDAFPEVELLALTENVGFARGTNIGLAALGFGAEPAPHVAQPAYVLALNPDTVVHPGAIEALVAFLDAHQRVGMVGPRLRNPDGSLQAAAFRFPTVLMTALDLFPPGEVLPGRLYNSWWHGRYPQERIGTEPFPIDHPLGACMLIRSAALAEVGGLDERYFMYSEEIDWCWRLRAAGWAIWQVPAAEVTHVGGAATSQFRGKMLVALYRSRAHFVASYYSARRRRAHRLVVLAGMLRAALRDWRLYGQGMLTRDQLRERLLTYGDIVRVTR
jgi:N-acetylglucosaminyl-diphospho-decaprenol L-rhamnosyltransferase